VLGKKISVRRNDGVETFIIVGIFEPPKSLLPAMGERAKVMYIPTTTAGRVLNLSDQIYYMQFSLKNDVDAENVITQMINVLERKHKNIDQNKFQKHKNIDQNKFQGESAEGQLEIINKVMKILTSVVGAIAAISLIVGGISEQHEKIY